MKKISAILIAGIIAMSTMCTTSFAAQSLDDIINENTSSVSESQAETNTSSTNVENVSNTGSDTQSKSDSGSAIGNIFGASGTYDQVDSLKDATKLNENSESANKINQGVKRIVSFIVQVLAYGVTALLVLRVLLDLAYICIPFLRSLLANGYSGNAQAGGQNNMGMGMNGGMGMGMNGMGMGMGMNRGMGMGMGMNGMNGMGMGMNGMGMQQPGQPGATPLRKIQWVSNAALNAVAAETVVGPDGKAVNPLKMYSKDMLVFLVLAPIFLVLAITGSLTNLGLLVGDMIAGAMSNASTMI